MERERYQLAGIRESLAGRDLCGPEVLQVGPVQRCAFRLSTGAWNVIVLASARTGATSQWNARSTALPATPSWSTAACAIQKFSVTSGKNFLGTGPLGP
jgi:hypothetical protein